MIDFSMMKMCEGLKNSPKSNTGISKTQDSNNFNKIMRDIETSTLNKVDDKVSIDKEMKEFTEEDIKKVLEDLEKELGDEYSKEDITNLAGLGMLVCMLDKRDESFISLDIEGINSLDSEVDFIDIQVKDVNDLESIAKEMVACLNFTDAKISIPLIKSMEETIDFGEKVIELIMDDNNSVDLELKNMSNEDISKVVNKFADESGLDIQNKSEGIITAIKSIASNKEISDLKVKNIYSTETKSTDLIGLEGVESLDKSFNIEKISYNKDVLGNSNANKESYNNFLFNQRVRNLGVESSDESIDKLIKIINKNVNDDVADKLNPYTYSTDMHVDDKISANVASQEVRQSHVAQDIFKSIKHMETNDVKELVLKVKPRELGEISIQLMKKGEISEVVIIVEREEIFNSTKRSLAEINAQLKDAGIKISNISVQMKSNDNNAGFNFMSNSEDRNFENQKNRSSEGKRRKVNEKNIEDEIDGTIKYQKINEDNGINLLA